MKKSIVCFLFMTSCFQSDEEQASVGMFKKNFSAKKQQEQNMKNSDEYVYKTENRRDPFLPYFASASLEIENDTSLEKQDTELYDVHQFRVTAIVSGISQPKAMLEDPSGIGHIVEPGTRIGKNGGKIARISDEDIFVVEDYVDDSGVKIKKEVVLKLENASTGNYAK